jgi:hypothetical protein
MSMQKVCYIFTLFFHKEKTGTSLVTEEDPGFFTGCSVDYSSVRIKHFIQLRSYHQLCNFGSKEMFLQGNNELATF